MLTEESWRANFTNERGVDGTIRYLHNVMGLWLLSESIRAWGRYGQQVDLGDALEAASQLPSGGPRVDPNHPAFLPPGDMPRRIALACRDSGQPVRESVPEVVRCILDSLAATFAATIDQAQRLSGKPIEVVHIVGGGSQNTLLCQLTADACGRPIIAGRWRPPRWATWSCRPHPRCGVRRPGRAAPARAGRIIPRALPAALRC